MMQKNMPGQRADGFEQGGDRRRFLAGLGAFVAGTALARPSYAKEAKRTRSGGRRIPLRNDARHVIAGDQKHELADVTFDVTTDYPDAKIGLEVGDRAQIDVLRIRLAPGVKEVDRFIRLGEGVRIGVIDVAAANQTSPHEKQLDGFLQIRRNDIRIDEVRFRNVDRCVMIHRVSNIWIGSFACESYSKGIKIDEAQDVYIGDFSATKASPHAAPHPGYNGLTVADSKRVHMPSVLVEDAAEHAIYLAGGAESEFNDGIRLGTVVTRRSGQCGLKCKASKTPSANITVDSLLVVDAAHDSKPGRNEDALRVENCNGFHIGSLETRCEGRKFSCYAGIYLDGVDDFSLTRGHVNCPAGPMVMIEDRRGAPNTRIVITGLEGSHLGSHGYLVNHGNGQLLSDLVVDGGRLSNVAGDAVRVEGNAQMAPGTNRLRLSVENVRGALSPANAAEAGLEVQLSEL